MFSRSNNKKWRTEIGSSINCIKQAVTKSRALLARENYVLKNSTEKDKARAFLADLKKFGFNDVETLIRLLSSEVKGKQDDNKFLLENLIKLLAKWDEGSPLGNHLTSTFINNLWNGLPHPPLTSLGTQYKYRSADGSFNNIHLPDLGKSDTPYARSAKPVMLQNIALPDPGVIFDSLMARDKFNPHPNKISSMLFYLATIIIHDIFRTDHKDFNISKSSSYLDLGPLYGNNQDEQDSIRTFKHGKLKPDCFSEKRILKFPPGVGVLMIMFNRFHNYVVTQLAAINEGGRFTKPTGQEDVFDDAWKIYDNDLFQTGRLITCGLYVNCILKDYVRTILSLNRVDTKWDLDPRTEEGKTLLNHPAPEGVGNQISAEFNVIYRWHSAISQRDDKWTQNSYSEIFPGQNPEDVTLEQLLGTLRKLDAELPDDPWQRPFAKLTRTPDGTYSDDDLVEILEASICDIAGSFGANRIPKILRSVEILGIMQARAWNLASLNEFRQFSGLTKHETFEDINPDPAVAEMLRNLYGHPDYVELYTGLVVEKAKPPMTPGSGLCVNFTTSYSILADAVSLVRGDRFYTVDYTAKSLTNWGYNEVKYDTSVDDGCVLYKLILRAFPNHFKENSIYAHFPFVIPEENFLIQTSLNRAEKYSWQRPARASKIIIIKSFAAAQNILNDSANWKVTYFSKISYLTSHPKRKFGTNFCLSGDAQPNEASRRVLIKSLHPKNWELEITRFFEQMTIKLLKAHRYKVPGKNVFQVDIVRDVSNLVHTRFAASIFSLPIKTEDFPRGIYTEQELYHVLSLLFLSIFCKNDLTSSFQINQAARILSQQLGDLALLNTESIAETGFIADLLAKLHESTTLSSYGTHMVQHMLQARLSIQDIVWSHIIPTAATMGVVGSQIFCQALDFYLGEGSKYLPDLFECSQANTKEADEKILRYFMEGARLSATMVLFRDYKPSTNSPASVVMNDMLSSFSVPVCQRVLIDLAVASRDPAAFPEPDEVILSRPLDSYLNYGLGSHQCAGRDISNLAMVTMFKTIFGLKGLKRAQGSGVGGAWYRGCESQGELKKVTMPNGQTVYMTPDQSSFLPFPSTMKIQWNID